MPESIFSLFISETVKLKVSKNQNYFYEDNISPQNPDNNFVGFWDDSIKSFWFSLTFTAANTFGCKRGK